jgi:hypothetical protein
VKKIFKNDPKWLFFTQKKILMAVVNADELKAKEMAS